MKLSAFGVMFDAHWSKPEQTGPYWCILVKPLQLNRVRDGICVNFAFGWIVGRSWIELEGRWKIPRPAP